MSEETATTTPTLLAVLAHPDDESFGLGGTLALYARRGVAVHLITATSGEAGTVDPAYLQGSLSVAELRGEKELTCAAQELGLSGVHLLGYRDSGMPGTVDNQHPQALVTQRVEVVAARIAECMDQIRPQVVVTHDPIGGYKHPDHIAVHQATVKAFNDLVSSRSNSEDGVYRPQKLYYYTFRRGFFKWVIRLAPLFGQDPRHWGRNRDIDVVALVEEPDFPVHAVIRYAEVADRKEAASACHASQLASGPPNQGLFALLLRLTGKKDQYMRAYPPAGRGLREDDLFAGVEIGSELVIVAQPLA